MRLHLLPHHGARAVAASHRHGRDWPAPPRERARRDSTGRPGVLAVVFAVAVVAVLTYGLHFLFR